MIRNVSLSNDADGKSIHTGCPLMTARRFLLPISMNYTCKTVKHLSVQMNFLLYSVAYLLSL